MNLSCQNENFHVLTCEISKTTESIELKLSGIIESINKLAVLKFQSNPIRLSIKSGNKEFWVIVTVGIYHGLVRTRSNH